MEGLKYAVTSNGVSVNEIKNGKHRGMERCCKIKEMECEYCHCPMERLGIRPEECIAFGDASNDMEMLKAAGLGIAVANAKESNRSSS